MTNLHVEVLNGFMMDSMFLMLKTCNMYRDAQMIMEDMKRTISELEQESSLPAVGVELVDNELATLYMNSKKSEVNTTPAVHRHHRRFRCLNELRVATFLSTAARFSPDPLTFSPCRLISEITLLCCDRLCRLPGRSRIL